MKGAGVLAAAWMLADCAPEAHVTIDGSSKANFAATVEKARRDLPNADRLAFDAALKSPPGRRYGDSDEELQALARTTYDGMTAVEVVDLVGR
jgi:hypothetical protein